MWLGLDHRHDDSGPPLIFESMVFRSEVNLAGLTCRRYATELEAAVGHEVLCEQWAKIPKEDVEAGGPLECEADEAASGA